MLRKNLKKLDPQEQKVETDKNPFRAPIVNMNFNSANPAPTKPREIKMTDTINKEEAPLNLEDMRKKLMYRSTHLGVREVEIILGDWLSLNKENLSLVDL